VAQSKPSRSVADLGRTVVLALKTALSGRFDARAAQACVSLLESIATHSQDEKLADLAGELTLGLGGFLGGMEPNPKQTLKLKQLAQGFVERLKPFLQTDNDTPSAAELAPISPTVLYLHGEQQSAPGLKVLLEARGWTLTDARTGEEIEELIDRTTPIAVVVDIDYLSAIAEVVESVERNQPQQAMRIPVIALAPTAQLPLKLQAAIGGADAFVVTRDPAQVLSKIDELMAPPEGQPFRVLIVDDDRQQSMYCDAVLKKKGMRTQAVASAEEALERLDTFAPELVIVDLHMPGLNGMELTALIRERAPALLLPIIFLTGEMDAQIRFDALNVGGDDFFTKPIRPRHLASAVVTRIKRARALRRHIGQGLASGSGKETAMTSRGALVETVKMALNGDRPTAVLFVAVDQLRGLDEIGLLRRNELESALTQLLLSALKPTDTISLWQDFSFVVLLQRDQAAELVHAAEAIQQKVLAKPVKFGNEIMQLTVSVGMAERMRDGDVEDWLNIARAACRFAHRGGGNAVERVPREIPDGLSLDDCFAIRELLREPPGRANTMMDFQPMVQLRGPHAGQYWGYLRLFSGDPGARPYARAEFASSIRDVNYLVALERHAIERAIETIEQHALLGKPLRLAIAISGDNLRHKFLDWVNKRVGRESRWAGALILAVDASTLASLSLAERSLVEGLPRPGVRLMMTGYHGTAEQQRLLDSLPISEVELASSLTEDAHPSDSLQPLAQIIAPLRLKARFVSARGLKHVGLLSNLWTLGIDYLVSDAIRAPGPRLDYDFSETKF